ncbi:MAG TPA: hexose kinase [Micromonosporaceae bacterium]|nr:hexose kinase [Micromonosporaceae bacterium]
MIVVVAANPALDVTYAVDALKPGTSHRVRTVTQRAGGKGVNVARVLSGLGHSTVVVGLAGGVTGHQLRAELDAEHLRHRFVPLVGETRRTVTVVAGGDATVFNEPGPVVDGVAWDALVEGVARALGGGATGLVCSGSLPPGAPAGSYAALVRLARDQRIPVVVDAEGMPLLAAARAGADLVKPNAAELAATTGVASHIQAAQVLRGAGAGSVAVSLGADGMLAVTGQGAWRVRLPRRLAGNPTGAGDAAAAAFVAGMASGQAWVDMLRHAVALSAAAVLAPVAGSVDVVAYHGLLPDVHVEEIDAAHPDR